MKRVLFVLFMLGIAFTLTGCAAGNPRFTDAPAGFWVGLWHGLICPFTFIISLFKDSVHIYEIHNTGHLYDLGFVLGVAGVFGGSSSSGACHFKSKDEKEWDEISDKVEKKVRKGIKEWLDETEQADAKEKAWDEIGRKVEEKIKRELRNWADS